MGGSHILNMGHYAYELPQERIADYPVAERDLSRLLVMRSDLPEEDVFRNLTAYLPEGGMMVFNDTRVIRARLIFRKATGARIEVFCLEPLEPTAEISTAFGTASPVVWKCLVGNARKWRSGKLLMELDTPEGPVSFYAEKLGETDGTFVVRFSWDPAVYPFARVIEEAGKVPLPPYIHREAEDGDISRYQTVYARYDGSVAAPTAGLHFTDTVLDAVRSKDILTGNVTLHVSAGTFKPVSHDDIHDHEMHTEQLIISRRLVEDLLANRGSVTAVGTTSMRTLESLYWYGQMLAENPEAGFHVTQWYPYREGTGYTAAEKSLRLILKYMSDHGLEEIHGTTSLIIIPSYRFRIVDILVTNFHMPRSTLLLLVAAFAGERWREAYRYALAHGFRFLSYGDSCLFYRNDSSLH